MVGPRSLGMHRIDQTIEYLAKGSRCPRDSRRHIGPVASREAECEIGQADCLALIRLFTITRNRGCSSNVALQAAAHRGCCTRPARWRRTGNGRSIGDRLQPGVLPEDQARCLAASVGLTVTAKIQMNPASKPTSAGAVDGVACLVRDLTLKDRPQYLSICGMKGRPSRRPLLSSVARISCLLRTCTQSPAKSHLLFTS